MANTVGYPSSSAWRTPRRHGKNISSHTSSYLQGYDASYHKHPRTRTSSSYGSYENFSLASSLPDYYGQSYLEQDYKIQPLSQDYGMPRTPHGPRRRISSRSFDPRASYISDMESREFGSHVDMIQSLQLRSSVVDTGNDLINTYRSYNSSFIRPNPLQSSSSSLMYDIGSNRNYSSIFSPDPLLSRDLHIVSTRDNLDNK